MAVLPIYDDRMSAGPELDLLVAKTLGVPAKPYSTSWDELGALMREHRIGVTPCGYQSKDGAWMATTMAPEGKPFFCAHADPLVAVIHCLMLSRGQGAALSIPSLN